MNKLLLTLIKIVNIYYNHCFSSLELMGLICFDPRDCLDVIKGGLHRPFDLVLWGTDIDMSSLLMVLNVLNGSALLLFDWSILTSYWEIICAVEILVALPFLDSTFLLFTFSNDLFLKLDVLLFYSTLFSLLLDLKPLGKLASFCFSVMCAFGMLPL